MRDKPNLLFIFTDEQSADTLGCYGNARIHTPHLDRLAANSVVFDRAYATESVCTPSRSSIMTGLYAHTNGCVRNNALLPLEVPCLPEMGDFRDYVTGYYGKWHLGDEIFPQHGFSHWRSIDDGYRPHYRAWRDRFARSTYYHYLREQGYTPDAAGPDGFDQFSRPFCARLPEEHSKPAYLGREASRFIRDHAAEPFVLFLNFFEPHFPYFGPRDGQYDLEEVTLPASHDRWPDEDHSLKARLLARGFRAHGCDAGPLQNEADWRRVVANYWGLVSLVDTHVGVVLDALDACGLSDDTIVVFTSDHGDMMAAHGLLCKCVQYEEAIRVPLLLRVPGLAECGRRIEAPVSQVDLVPTLLRAMGQPLPDHLEGYDWGPYLRGEGPLGKDNVFVEWTGNDGWGHGVKGGQLLPSWLDIAPEATIRDAMTGWPALTILTPDGWKYTHRPRGVDELYDLNADPSELTNRAAERDQAARIEALRARMAAWRRRTGARSEA